MVIVCFSQGTMMALHVGLRRERQLAGIVGYSGMRTGAATLGHALRAKPPVPLIHGSADPIVPVAATHAAKADLERLGVPATTHVSAGLGHGVDPVGPWKGGEFVAQALMSKR